MAGEMVFDLDPNVIGPKSQKQYDFMHSEADITVFGGAAGAGKSYLGVLDFLKHIQDPNFRGCMVRRTTPQLKGPGGLLEKSEQLFRILDPKVRWRDKEHHFAFSNGAKIYLRHFENPKDKDNFQGWEVSQFLVDEGQQFEEEMVEYLTSRMRNPRCTSVKPHMKITCNPEYGSFLRIWLEWYLDQETGIPIPERSGVVRYFLKVDGKMLWGDTRQELIERYGKPDLEPTHPKQVKPMSFKFISANVYDNPILCNADPEYVYRLENLGRVEKEKLLYGSWMAREQGAGYFKGEWCNLVHKREVKAIKRVRAWDISGTIASETNRNPDWTAGVLMARNKLGTFTVEDVVRDRRQHGGVFELMLETARHDGDDVQIIIPCDPGAAGKAYAAQIIRDLADHGFYARMKQTNKSKVTRFAPFAATCEAGNVEIVEADWTKDYLLELERFDGSKNIKDDQVDATSDAFHALSSEQYLPDFAVPTMTQANPFAFYR